MSLSTTYYDGTKLLSLSDINGEKPELFLCTSNRSAGKTTYFSRLLVNRFKKRGEKFAVLYRFNYELDDCADKFFKEIQSLFFQEDNLTSRRAAAGIYHELFLNDEPCGYAISMNSADQLKKYGHFFSDTVSLFFDEFQSETSHYCANEVRKFISLHTTMARGSGKQARYLPCYMCSNPVTLLNPYYVSLGISSRLQTNTRFLRGDGFVLEQGFNESASHALASSAFNRAFSADMYVAYATQNVYLNDSIAFIETPRGKNRYLATIRVDGQDFAIREFPEVGVVYCDRSVDTSSPYKVVVSSGDHNVNYVMLRHNDLFIQSLRWYFDRGCFRFKNIACKQAIMTAISL